MTRLRTSYCDLGTAPRLKSVWPPQVERVGTSDGDINALVHTSVLVKKSGVFWVDGVQSRMREGQVFRCPVDAYINYMGDERYKPEDFT